MSAKQATHKQSNTRLYGIWCAMKRRCNNKNTIAYADYGGRGIQVCDEWLNNYVAFMEWALSNGYSEILSIDRIDNDGNYEPSNCRWVDSVAQVANRRSNVVYTYNSESHIISEWASIFGIPYKTLHYRLSHGWDIADALKK